MLCHSLLHLHKKGFFFDGRVFLCFWLFLCCMWYVARDVVNHQNEETFVR